MPVVYQNEGHKRRMMENYHRYVWKLAEWRKDPHCRKCERVTSMDPRVGWKNIATVDHVLSRGLGGSDTEENFELLCGKCNQRKSRTENPPKKTVDNS